VDFGSISIWVSNFFFQPFHDFSPGFPAGSQFDQISSQKKNSLIPGEYIHTASEACSFKKWSCGVALSPT
jgi:hypothetical protein